MATYWVCSNDTPRSGHSMKGAWAANTAYSLGDIVVPRRTYGTAAAKKYVYECSTAGTSDAATEPTWGYATPGTTTTNDGTAVWRCEETTSADHAGYHVDYINNNRAAAGDTIYVFNTHSESVSDAGYNLAGAGTVQNPVKVICTSSFSSPALATGATITQSGNYAITLPVGNSVFYGIDFVQSGSGSSQTIDVRTRLEQCALTLGTSASAIIRSIANPNVLKNCVVKFGHADQKFRLGANSRIEGQRGTYFVDDAGTKPTALFQINDYGGTVVGCNLSNLSTKSLITSGGPGVYTFVGCTLPVSFTIGTPSDTLNSAVYMIDCNSGDVHYDWQCWAPYGSAITETTKTRTGGATVAGQLLSRKVVTDADCKRGYEFFFDLYVWNTTVDSSVTATVYIAQESGQAALQEGQCWLEIAGKLTSNSTLYSFADDSNSTMLTASTTDQTTDSVSTWNITNAVKQTLSVPFTPREVGLIRGRVYFAAASRIVYVDPVLYLS